MRSELAGVKAGDHLYGMLSECLSSPATAAPIVRTKTQPTRSIASEMIWLRCESFKTNIICLGPCLWELLACLVRVFRYFRSAIGISIEIVGKTAYIGWKEHARQKKVSSSVGFAQFCILNSPRKGDVAFVTSGAGEVTLFNAFVSLFLTLRLFPGIRGCRIVSVHQCAVGYMTKTVPSFSFVIQLAKLDGVKVIASAGSKEKVKYMKEIGADVAFNYKTTNTMEVLEKEGPLDM
jgi:Zinc-binding dehydrogenase